MSESIHSAVEFSKSSSQPPPLSSEVISVHEGDDFTFTVIRPIGQSVGVICKEDLKKPQCSDSELLQQPSYSIDRTNDTVQERPW